MGKEVHHKFQISVDGETKWYRGTILSYDSSYKTHKILYDQEEPCSFDIILDFLNGDLKVIG